MKKIIPTEYQDCICFTDWLKAKGIKHAHIPNETFTTSFSTKMKNKRLGVSRGFPDYAIIVNGKLIFIEMKREKGGAVSEEQKEWIEALNDCEKVEARICRGFEEAKWFVEETERRSL